METEGEDCSAPFVVSGLVAEWIHFTLFGITIPITKLKVYTFGGLMNSATKQGPREGFRFWDSGV